jgi:hypothetical protein
MPRCVPGYIPVPLKPRQFRADIAASDPLLTCRHKGQTTFLDPELPCPAIRREDAFVQRPTDLGDCEGRGFKPHQWFSIGSMRVGRSHWCSRNMKVHGAWLASKVAPLPFHRQWRTIFPGSDFIVNAAWLVTKGSTANGS